MHETTSVKYPQSKKKGRLFVDYRKKKEKSRVYLTSPKSRYFPRLNRFLTFEVAVFQQGVSVNIHNFFCV